MEVDLSPFLKALDDVANDLKCPVCKKFFKDPLKISKCLHIICSEHYKSSLKYCPECGVDVSGSTTSPDAVFTKSVEYTKSLLELFSPYIASAPIAIDTPDIEAIENTIPVHNTRANKKKTSTPEHIQPPSKRPALVRTDSHNKIKRTSSINTLKTNLNIEKRNSKGETQLHVACRVGKLEKILECLEAGANVNTKDNAGWTPLHEAVQNNLLDIVTLLLKHKALINVPGQSNETPLHEAVRYGHKEIIKELVKNGAHVNMVNSKGETPMQLANPEIKKILKDSSVDMQVDELNISMMSDNQAILDLEEMYVFCVSDYKTIHARFKMLAKSHSSVHIEPKFTKKVTHLIVDAENLTCLPNLEIYFAIVHHLWILSSDWVLKSNDKKLASLDKYEINGIGKSALGPKRSRFNSYKMLPGLFHGCHMYLHNFHTNYEISKKIVLTKSIITKLIIDAGGTVLRRVPNPESIPESEIMVPFHARKDGKLAECSHYIIFKDMYEPMYNMKHLKALPIGWLMECIEKFELCEDW